MRIAFIGGGNMATALISGLLRQGFAPSDFTVMDVSAQARERIASLGITTCAGTDGLPAVDVAILAVKPQQLREVAQQVGKAVAQSLIVSIAAGIRTSDLARWLDGHQRLVRAMPNTPALIGSGMTGLYAMPAATAADRHAAERILGAIGAVRWFDREQALDAVTAVSGSGPAYVFYFIEAIEQAAIELGLDADAARELALQTFLGASKLAAQSQDPPAQLRHKVTSRGGTTERALQQMESAHLRQAIIDAVKAAAARARELGDELAGDSSRTS